MENRNWEYWLKRLKEANEGKAPSLTDDEIVEMFKAGDPPGYSEEEKIHIRQHGTWKQKVALKMMESVRVERDAMRKTVLEGIEQRKREAKDQPAT